MSRRTLPALLAAALLAACASAPRDREEPPAPPPAPLPAAAVPRAGGPLAPSETVFSTERRPSGAIIANVDDCESCHADVAAQWRSSAHAFASFTNPAYRVSIDRFRAAAGPEKSRHCGGCHDIALLADGVLDRAVTMRGDVPMPPAEASDKRTRTGVACRVCHGIEEARPDGNGSYTLTAKPVVLPQDGDADSVRRHKESVALAPLRTAAMCGTCHRSFLFAGTSNPHFLPGADEMTPWSRSIYAGSKLGQIDEEIAEKDCRGCHMPKEDAPRGDAAAKDGKVASHRFPGGHTWMAAMRGDAEQLAREQKQLEGAAGVDVAAVVHPQDGTRTLPADGAPVAPGEPLVLDVVIKNRRVGHRFPGGTLDAQDTWIEVTVDDARGRRIAEAGTRHEESGADPTAHVLRALLLGEDGAPRFAREVNEFRAVACNNAIAPREAAVVEFAFDAPDSLEGALPLAVTVRLRHRSRSLDLQRIACADQKTPWGRAFAAADGKQDAGQHPGLRPDKPDYAPGPCAPQPVTEIARSVVHLGAGGPAPAADAPAWSRLLDHALGLQHAVQERLDEARPSLMRALAEVEGRGDLRAEARVTWALGWLEAHEGRTEEALRRADRAAALLPDHPAIAALRGDALSLVWRWAEAVPPLDEAARVAPKDDSAWAKLAIALGSRGGDDRAALAAALAGLALQPRDPDMLRVEALSLGALRDERAAAAEAAYDTFRPADVIPGVKARCSAKVPGCALERNPVHVHRMRQASER
jgi:tetratricopeptide (TPR) repeat protein